MVDVHSFAIPRDELHMSLGGGFPHGSIAIIEGNDAMGKSTLSQRFLYGFLVNGYSVSVISTELTLKEFISQMYSLDYKIATPLLNDQFMYISVYPLMKKARIAKDYIKQLMGADEIFKKDIIIIDTLSLMLKNTIHAERRIMDLLSFFKRLSALKKTVIATIQPEELSADILTQLRESSNVYLSLKTTMIGTYLNRQIFVKRFSNTAVPVEDVIGFRVEPGIGVVVEIMKYA